MDNKLFPNIKKNKISNKKHRRIIDTMSSKSCQAGDEGDIFAGYTYLGQMITHDIVESTNDGNSRIIRKADLVLNCIYGEVDFKVKDCNKDNYMFEETGEFKFSDPSNADIFTFQMDLFRDGNKVNIPELRNDENFLISQLHLFWQKLHNTIINSITIEDYCVSQNVSIENKFKVTKKLVIKLFQKVVVEDFLFNILDIDIYNAYLEKINDKSNDLFFYNKEDKMLKVPLEFSHAAFRFGHSMVRDSYDVNNNSNLSLSELLNINHESIDSKNIVNWISFFGTGKIYKKAIKSLKINDIIVNPMSRIPNKNPIIELDLKAGVDGELASGWKIIKHIRKKNKYVAKILKINKASYKKINILNYDFLKLKKIPLWLYVLLESGEHPDKRLGKLGSIIVAETIFKSIQQADISIFSDDNELLDNKLQSRLNEEAYSCPDNFDNLFIGINEDFKRFKMSDLIQLVNEL